MDVVICLFANRSSDQRTFKQTDQSDHSYSQLYQRLISCNYGAAIVCNFLLNTLFLPSATVVVGR